MEVAMWHTLKMSEVHQPDFAASVRELLQSTFRHLVLITGGVYLLWYFATTGSSLGELSLKYLPLTVSLALTFALSLHLLPRHFVAAQAVWQIGLAANVALGVYISEQPVVAFFYALLPLMAVVTGGWPAGLLAEGLVAAAVTGLAYHPAMPPFPYIYFYGIVIGSAISGLLGWATIRALITAVEWSFYGVEWARQNMEDARQHRARLAKVLKDLDMAYHRLERANSALLLARDTAVAAERFKAEFVANVSHELRTPLNLIIGFSEVMATAPESYGGAPLPSAYRGDVMAIYRSAQHLSDLIDDVLDLSQIEAGRMPLSKESVDLADVISEAIAIMRNLAEAHDLALEVDMPDNLPLLHFDRTRIRQVLLNLLSNAMRYTEHGGIKVQARLNAHDVVVTVTDTGAGIPPDRLVNAFQMFSQLEEGHAHDGSGLGLALSKKFVELHGGRIWLESELGRGTTVGFSLPMPSEREAGHILPGMTAAITRYHKEQPFVFVLHDDTRILSSLRRRIDGYRVMLADTVEKASDMLRESFPAAVIMDSSWATRWETITPTLNLDSMPVIKCPLPSHRQLGRMLRAADYLPKPITREDLQQALARLPEPPNTVLIVDDDPRMVRLLARLLKTISPPTRILEAFSGEEGLAIARSQHPGLLLLDLVMSAVDGYAVLEQISGDETLAGMQVIITSARDLSEELTSIKGELQIGCHTGFSYNGMLNILQAVLAATVRQPTTALTTGAAPPAVSPGSPA
jgi:signal transduction histidine kinase/CheY-like chemotaxis protein